MAWPPAWTVLRLVSARSCTAVGSPAYCRDVPSDWPSVTSHLNRYTTALPLAGSVYAVYRKTQLKAVIGYDVAPGSLVIEKLVGLTLVLCDAAAVAPATLACTKLPSAFFRYAWLILACTTYASSLYPMAPGGEVTDSATPAFCADPMPTGHETPLATQTLSCHSLETLER